MEVKSVRASNFPNKHMDKSLMYDVGRASQKQEVITFWERFKSHSVYI